MTKINSEQICEVRILDKRPHIGYEYREAKKSWLWGNQKEGFYDTITIGAAEFMTVEDIERSGELVCIDKKVYFRPRIVMKMSNGDVKYKYFDTLDMAEQYFKFAPALSILKWLSL